VQGLCGIDSEAGPTEIGILADDTAVPAYVAADLVAQAEHDPLAACLLVTPSVALLDAVDVELGKQVPVTRHRERVETALAGQSAHVLVEDLDHGLAVVDAGSGAVRDLAAGGAWSAPHWTTGDGVVAQYEDHATPPELRLLDAAGPATRTVLAPAPLAVRRAPHVRPDEITFRSRDGMEIPAFLFRPPTAAPERPTAAIVYPHGGPTDAYGDHWDGHAQYFLDKGYAWLAVNFRGSTGYGRDFERANHGVWGVEDVWDCLAAADHLRGLDWVDGERLGIFGASYGSYMALLSVTDDPEHRFRCAVAKYGDCDILTSWAQGDREGVQDLERMMGHPSMDDRAGTPLVAALAPSAAAFGVEGGGRPI